jgi:hypothetical protein
VGGGKIIFYDRISRQKAEIEQLKQRDRDRMARQSKRERELHNRRIYLIGETIIRHFPDTLPFTLKQTREERDVLAASFDSLIAGLRDKQEPIRRLIDSRRQSKSQ